MTTLSSLLIAAIGTLAPAYVVQPESLVDYAALAILGVILFRFTHDLMASHSARR